MDLVAMDLEAMDPGQWIGNSGLATVDRSQGMGALNRGQWIGAVAGGAVDRKHWIKTLNPNKEPQT
jgi:hypothetical protein